jgi:hypothetical protein
MVSREQAIDVAWRLFTASVPASEVREVKAELIDGTWSVVFYKRQHPDYFESPGFALILVPESGIPEWFPVM